MQTILLQYPVGQCVSLSVRRRPSYNAGNDSFRFRMKRMVCSNHIVISLDNACYYT